MKFFFNIRADNKVFIVFYFFTGEEILLDTNTLSISTFSKKYGFYNSEIYVFQFQYQRYNIFNHFYM